MTKNKKTVQDSKQDADATTVASGRRGFLRTALTAAGLLALGGTLAGTACKCDDDEPAWSDESDQSGGSQPTPEDNPPEKPKENPPPTENPDDKNNDNKTTP